MLEEDVATAFLQTIVENEECAYGTQKQALNALASFFKNVCGMEDPVFGIKLRKTGRRTPVVLSKGETVKLQEDMRVNVERYALAAHLQYGEGLRRSELMALRSKDVDLDRGTLTIRQGKGDKDRTTVLPRSLVDALAVQIEKAREIWEAGGLKPVLNEETFSLDEVGEAYARLASGKGMGKVVIEH